MNRGRKELMSWHLWRANEISYFNLQIQTSQENPKL